MFAKPYATCCRTVHPPENLLGWMDFKTSRLAKGSGWSLCSLLPMLKQPSWAWRNWKRLKECYFWTARLTPHWFVLMMQPLTYPLLVLCHHHAPCCSTARVPLHRSPFCWSFGAFHSLWGPCWCFCTTRNGHGFWVRIIRIGEGLTKRCLLT